VGKIQYSVCRAFSFMIIVLKPHTSEEEIQQVIEKVRQVGLTPHLSTGAERTVIGAIGSNAPSKREIFEALPMVEKVVPILKEYKLVSRDFKPQDTIVKVGDVEIGGDEVVVMAGPCAVENEKSLIQAALAVKAAGGRILRGGAFKPRTSPYSFQGLGVEGLKLLSKAREETGLPVVTELMDARDIDVVAKYSDMIQIGARNSQNFTLLKEVGMLNKPVLLKRGISGTIKELLMSAEYIRSEGNNQIVLCERGIRTYEDSTRNTFDLSAIPVVKSLSHLPIIADPSHALGKRDYVPAMALAAVAAGAHGLMIEVHVNPAEALCDGPQATYPHVFMELMKTCRRVAEAIGKKMPYAPVS
jgi:3-deoxy-7-phosphoheptulonate synthase